MTDLKALVTAIKDSSPDAPFRLRQGVIVSVQNGSCTVTIGGSSTQIAGVHYASHTCPLPGATCWLATDGRDWMVLATLAPSGPAFGAMRQNAAQSIPNNAFTALDWTTRTDTTATGVTLGNTGITCVVPGLYQVTATGDFVANATGQRHMTITVNGTTAIAGFSTNAVAGADITRMNVHGTVKLAIGDIVNSVLYQSSGAALNTNIAIGQNMLRITWLGPAA